MTNAMMLTLRAVLVLALVVVASCSAERAGDGKIVDQHGKAIEPIPEPAALDSAQVEIRRAVDLLDADGKLAVTGWARAPVARFNPENIRADARRVKKWEHYTFYGGRYAGGVTISDIATVGMGSVELFDMETGREVLARTLMVRPGAIAFPDDTKGDLEFRKGSSFMVIRKRNGLRTAEFRFDEREGGETIVGRLVFREHGEEALAIITPFEDPLHFFYEYKVPSLSVEGEMSYRGKTYPVKSGESYGVLDWGRGAWPQKNRWLWAAGGHTVKGKLLSFNLGYGFGSKAGATENGIVYGGRVHKLGRVVWKYDISDYMKPWTFKSADGRCEMSLRPVYLLHSDITLAQMFGFLKQLWSLFSLSEIREIVATEAYLNKVIGYYTGFVVLDDGTRLEVKDMPGFAEVMYQVW
ncbi:MAG TPA: DUF2804 domain-containing protein [Spirochaetota bacterium]|nr:DUF2804 domain-containing protein [Spirochaetota bacterium]